MHLEITSIPSKTASFRFLVPSKSTCDHCTFLIVAYLRFALTNAAEPEKKRKRKQPQFEVEEAKGEGPARGRDGEEEEDGDGDIVMADVTSSHVNRKERGGRRRRGAREMEASDDEGGADENEEDEKAMELDDDDVLMGMPTAGGEFNKQSASTNTSTNIRRYVCPCQIYAAK